VLRKDFIILPYQIYETVAMGADAVLLIVRALSREMLKELVDLSHELQLDALVEVHSEQEMTEATLAGARLIGINNRDLSSFQTDLQTSIRLARQIQDGQVAVAESGIHEREQIESLLAAGIWNFLIGESLVRTPDPEALLRGLLGR
jgi:indole-3-glycerol phosphate synthase